MKIHSNPDYEGLAGGFGHTIANIVAIKISLGLFCFWRAGSRFNEMPGMHCSRLAGSKLSWMAI